MNEKEKMLAGMLYNPETPELIADRERVKVLCFEYNNTIPNNREKRISLMSEILGKTGDKCWIEQNFWCDYGYNIEVGENFYANHNLTILDPAKVVFGDNVFIGPNCGFYTAEHPLKAEERNKLLEYAYPITVGNNVWIGGSVTILAGVNIGDNVVIGAGSVVTKDIPSNCVALGNPCRVIKTL